MADDLPCTDFSPAAIVAAVQAGTFEGLAQQVMLDLEDSGWVSFVASVAGEHNNGTIDLLAAARAGGPIEWGAERLYGDVLPLLDATVQDMLDTATALAARSKSGDLPFFVPEGFAKWCDGDPARPDAALAAIGAGTGPTSLLIATLNAGLRAARSRYLAILVSLLNEGSAEETYAAAVALGNVVPDSAQERELVEAALADALASEDLARRASAFRAALSIGARTPADEPIALSAIAAVEEGATPDIRQKAADGLFLGRNNPSVQLVTRLCDLLRATPKGEAGAVAALDRALAQHLTGATAAPRLTLLRDVLASGVATLKAMETTAHYILNDKGTLLSTIVADWLAEGADEFVSAVFDLTMQAASAQLTFDLDFARHNLDAVRTMTIGRKIVSRLMIFPDTAVSIILSLLRTGHPDAAPALEEILFDPLMISYWEGPRKLLEVAAPRQSAPVAQLIARVIARLDAYVAAIQGTRIIAELGPSERQRFLRAALEQEQSRSMRKEVRRKSIFVDLFPTRVLLYGDSAVSQVYHSDGKSTREEFRLSSFEHSREIARLDAIDPFGFWYQRLVLAMDETP